MHAAIADRELDALQDVRVIHALRGRLRAHLATWTGKGQSRIESRLRSLAGVRSAQANPLTGNVLIKYDPAQIDEVGVLDALHALCGQLPRIEAEAMSKPSRPPVHAQVEGEIVRAQIAVRGLDRSPHLARHVVERLQRFPGVRAHANPLTGRVLVEFVQHEVDLEDLIAEVADVEQPEVPEEDHPIDPLDPAPLVQSLTRTVSAALGLGLLAVQQLPGVPRPLVDPTIPANISGIIGLLRSFPFLREGARRLFGRNATDAALSMPNIAALALSNGTLGLAVIEAESAILLHEVRSRQAAWRHYEEHLQHVAAATPGAVVRLENGETTSLDARVIEGVGTYADRSGRPAPVSPGQYIPAGSRLFGESFVLEMQAQEGFEPQERSAPLTPTLYDQYTRIVAPISLGYALVTAVLTRSLSRTFAALLLVNPRVAIIGMEAANLDAATRVLRSGVTVAGTRQDRMLRRPDVVLLDGARLICDRYEATSAVPLARGLDTAGLLALAGGVAGAAGSPWGGAFRTAAGMEAEEGHFNGSAARARIGGVTYALGPLEDFASVPEAASLRQRGDCVLQLTSERASRPLGILALRPRLSPSVDELVDVCRRRRVLLALLPGNDALTARALAKRAGIAMLDSDDALGAIQSRQALGQYIAFVSDGAHASKAFDACDLAIGLTDGRNPLAARADLLAPDLRALAAIIEAGARRDAAVRDSVGVSAMANIAGAVWGFQGAPGVERASTIVYGAALAALADGWWRLRGGERPRTDLTQQIVDPRPERWGARTVESALEALHTSEDGLTTSEALARRRQAPPALEQRSLLVALIEQLKSPLNAILGAGAGISLLLGAPADVGIIGATLAANSFIGAWQERRASQVAETLNRLGAAKARVLRDGQPLLLPAGDVVPGDVLLLAPGDRITADARLIESRALEVDEAALTGESLPILKAPDSPSDAARIVLDGSDITTGYGRAVAFAVGRETRMGSIAAALAAATEKGSPLDQRLSQLIGQVLPLAVAGGAIVTGAGWLRTRSLVPQLAIGATITLAAMPEGLPLLTKISEAGVARRLAERRALTRRLSAVETLGRVGVACTDKTGTLTQGRLSLRLVATPDDGASNEAHLPLTSDQVISDDLRAVLRGAALASPHPEAEGAAAHPTDVAVTTGAEAAGLGEEIRVERESELPFDPARAFHAVIVDGHLYVKGAPEALIPRCVARRRSPSGAGGEPYDELLGDADRERLLARAEAFAAQGLRMLMVAERPHLPAGERQIALDDPHDLIPLGFVGISDPLRPTVPAAVRRCREAGVRVIMLTGDHPSTARAIAHEAGLLDGNGRDGVLLTGMEIAELHNSELDAAIERADVIARATPLDKVRIVESLQRHGHIVAMTGDGVNDAPALRLADVGVAMGRGGTEVARQTADVVLADDDFATLVEALVEGRSFWQNIRRALGLLLGGNLGELGLVVGATAVGLASPMTARQILVVNMITDVLPGLAVALQPPEHRNLAGLARESASALDKPLTNEILRRGALTAGPSLVAYALSRVSGTYAQAQTVAFTSVVGTQLAQTLDAGWSEGRIPAPIVGAVGGSAALAAGAIALPPLRQFLGLAAPGATGWALIGGSALAALGLSRLFDAPQRPAPSSPRIDR